MVELRVGPGVRGFQAEIWTDIPDVLAVSLYSPSGEQIQKVPIRQNSRNEYRFLLEQTTVIIDYRLLVERTNSELIILRFINPAEGIWKIGLEPLQSIDGRFSYLASGFGFSDGRSLFSEVEPGRDDSGAGKHTVSYYRFLL